MPGQQFPEPIVGAFVVNPQGKILLMKSGKWLGKWVVPGGHVELGETLEQALRREVKEETGLDISDLQFICFDEFVNEPTFWKTRHFIFFDFVCRARSTTVRLNSEGQDHVWVSPAEAETMDLEAYTRKALDTWLSKKGPVTG